MKRIDKDWKEYKTIGDIAESVVEFIIESTPDWKCIKFGMENHIAELKKRLMDNTTSTALKIRSMPDFIAINEKTKEVKFVDGKYRSFIDFREPMTELFGFGYGQIKDYLEHWRGLILIIVVPREPYFYVVDTSNVEWFKHFWKRQTEEGKNKLWEQWNFHEISKDVKSLFPNLPEEAYQKAISMIPKRDPKKKED